MIHLFLSLLLLLVIALAGRGIEAALVRAIPGYRTLLVDVDFGLISTLSLARWFTFGCAFLGLLFPLIGFVSYTAVTLSVLVSLPAIAGLSGPWKFVAWSRPNVLDMTLIVAMATVAVLGFAGAMTPEVRHDPLFYHVEVPRLWLNFGRILEIPENGHSYFPYGFEVFYGWALGLGSDSAAKSLHWCAGLAAAAWCASIARQADANGLHAAAIFYFLPTITYLSSTTYIDLATAMYGLGAVAILLGTRYAANSPGGLMLAGFLAGSAMATKYTAWPLVGVPIGVAALVLARRSPRAFVMFCVVAALPLLPWVGRNFASVGNPLAPLMVKHFGPESAVRTGLAGAFDGFASRDGGALGLLLSPMGYAQHLIMQKYMVSLLGLLAVLLLMRSKASNRGALSLLLIAMFLCEAAFTRGHPDGRYGLVSMGIGAVLLAMLCRELAQKSGKGRCWVAPLLALALFASVLGGHARLQNELGERWIPILDEKARDEYRAARIHLPANFAETEAYLATLGPVRVLGAAYPSKSRYWLWIQGMRNDFVDDAGGTAAAPKAIREALLKHGAGAIMKDSNPGFDTVAWKAFLATETEETRPGVRVLRTPGARPD